MTTRPPYVADAMLALEGMPCGGIGSNGATLEDLAAADEVGQPFDDDASYHVAQLAWRLLERGYR